MCWLMIGPCSGKCHYMENTEYAYTNLSVIPLNYSLGQHAALLKTTSNFNTLAKNYVFKPVKTKKIQRNKG